MTIAFRATTGTPVAVPAKPSYCAIMPQQFLRTHLFTTVAQEKERDVSRNGGRQRHRNRIRATCAPLCRSGAVLEFLHFISSSFNGVLQRSFYNVLYGPPIPLSIEKYAVKNSDSGEELYR